jgi:hypothetical protein
MKRATIRRSGWLGMAAALAIAGCQRDPLDRQVSAGTALAFNAWQSRNENLGAENRRRLAEALQEIRFGVMGEREIRRRMGERVASGTEEIDAELRKKIDGKPLRDVLQLGYEMRVRRLRRELAGLETAMAQNARLVTRPGDVDSKHHLEGLRDRQATRVAKYREESSPRRSGNSSRWREQAVACCYRRILIRC